MKKILNKTKRLFSKSRLTCLAVAAISFMAFSSASAIVPDLYVDGVVIDQGVSRLTNESEDFKFAIGGNWQRWELLNQSDDGLTRGQSFGFYSENAGRYGETKSILFGGFATWNTITTTLDEGTDVGFWMVTNPNGNSSFDSGYRSLYSERNRSLGTSDTNSQAFMMYDVRQYGEAEFEYGDWSGTGDYDYLMFIEDDSRDGWDNDDIVVGLTVAPEPGTLLLLGTGLLGTGLAIRRRKF